ncbi:MAG: hypothetical protein AAGF20_12050 [Pseudomonadota bacterium]
MGHAARYMTFAALLALWGCAEQALQSASPPPVSAKPETAPVPKPKAAKKTYPEDVQLIAMDLWHNANPDKHPKGSCAGCHGADFYDLARIGSSEVDIARRAIIDGASEREADALVQAIFTYRRDYNMPPEDARKFRPFQPGGRVLLPELQDPPHLAAVKRDIAFGQQLERLLPTLFGAPIASTAEAEQARREMLDLAEGTNLGGHNPQRVQLRDLPTGIVYPLWSADKHHGGGEATVNDWVADVAHIAKPEYERDWMDVQLRYLDNPNRENFWRMYHAASTMVEPLGLGACSAEGINPHLSCGAVDDFALNKFKSALLGQHMLRTGDLLQDQGFAEGALAFSYLDDAPELRFMLDRKDPHFLPGNKWEIADRARVMLEKSNREGSLSEELSMLGFPGFVVDSVNGQATSGDEQQALRLAWFWIGFTFDPSFARVHASNSTKSGEYMIESLLRENMFLHNSFASHMRIVVKGTLQDANMKRVSRQTDLEAVPPTMKLNYSYFVGYNRTVLRWKEDKKAGKLISSELKAEQEALWHRFTANGFRMGLVLLRDELQAGAEPSDVPADPIKVHFDTYQPEHQSADYDLMNTVKALIGDEETYTAY